MNFSSLALAGLASIAAVASIGCDDDHAHPTPAADKHAHGPDDGHAHGPNGEHAAPAAAPGGAAPVAGHGGPVIALGSATAGPYVLDATRDQGPIVAGKDAPIDVTVIAIEATAPKPAAVRFWVGTEDAKGSAKAKAEVENPAEPNRWHTHAEIPDPLPDGAKLWVELEVAGGEKRVASFDLKR